jgi:hypothetical protein
MLGGYAAGLLGGKDDFAGAADVFRKEFIVLPERKCITEKKAWPGP